MKKIPAFSLQRGDQITLHLVVDSVETYNYGRTAIVSIGDATNNLILNLDGDSALAQSGWLTRGVRRARNLLTGA